MRGLSCKQFHFTNLLQGSVCLYYKPLKILFTGDHFAKSEDSKLSIFEQYNKVSGILSIYINWN